MVTRSAAPGVDQASETGVRCRSASQSIPRAWATQSASRPDAAWSGVAPTAVSPASTTTKEEENPTTAATTPALTGVPCSCMVAPAR